MESIPKGTNAWKVRNHGNGQCGEVVACRGRTSGDLRGTWGFKPILWGTLFFWGGDCVGKHGWNMAGTLMKILIFEVDHVEIGDFPLPCWSSTEYIHRLGRSIPHSNDLGFDVLHGRSPSFSTINLPFGNGSYHPLMLGMVYLLVLNVGNEGMIHKSYWW